jgi:hypothetical protein
VTLAWHSSTACGVKLGFQFAHVPSRQLEVPHVYEAYGGRRRAEDQAVVLPTTGSPEAAVRRVADRARRFRLKELGGLVVSWLRTRGPAAPVWFLVLSPTR